MKLGSVVWVAGGRTAIGRALLEALRCQGHEPLPDEPELIDATEVSAFFARHGPQYVFYAAGRVLPFRPIGRVSHCERKRATLVWTILPHALR